ncbi:MAG TPA: PQQ-binding-like beta-propeller repeat protein [Thermoanaerobaculia bacterium]|nr:PQQ-binding-like beta-propeller repeat protein [Thermoanaerobaculia bacterium]
MSLPVLLLCAARMRAQTLPQRLPVVRALERLTPDRSSPGDWPRYCGDDAMTGQATGETAITPQTAPSLSPVWVAQLPGSIASSPTVVGANVYIGDWSGQESRLDAATGTLLASVDLGQTLMPQCNPDPQGITSAPAFSNGLLLLAGGDDGFYCLDAGSLKILWRRSLGDNSPSGGYYAFCSPLVVAGRVLQGISSNCDNPFIPGKLFSMDRETGALLGQADLVPASMPGGGIWSSPSVDLESGQIFVTTASGVALDDGYAYSIVRLSLSDLSIRDSWRVDPGNTPDADWGSSPTLFTDSAGRQLVGAGQKDGSYYAFLRSNLAAGPVWRTAMAIGGECPQCGAGVLATAAFDGKRLYAAGGIPPDWTRPSIVGSVAALDPGSGTILWRTVAVEGPVIAPVSIANGVVFAAGAHSALALDAETGAILWEFDDSAVLYGGIAISRGRIYFGDVEGRLYAFGIPGTSAPPAAGVPATGSVR